MMWIILQFNRLYLESAKEKNRDNFSLTIQEKPTIKYHTKKALYIGELPLTGAVKVTMEVKMTKILIRHYLCLVNCP
jgi:hypothetical protein